ncbi:uncharacterized protein LOC113283466 [Papaver somniferum]|uniref:uncharacterized protein LOC113283466 n=1 Tax=Papaver somniferum TaxID=3469 RepID=UPI000E6FCEDE|nr:uncharacterized protein LOC113283466 [Papaver somniferum]
MTMISTTSWCSWETKPSNSESQSCKKNVEEDKDLGFQQQHKAKQLEHYASLTDADMPPYSRSPGYDALAPSQVHSDYRQIIYTISFTGNIQRKPARSERRRVPLEVSNHSFIYALRRGTV